MEYIPGFIKSIAMWVPDILAVPVVFAWLVFYNVLFLMIAVIPSLCIFYGIYYVGRKLCRKANSCEGRNEFNKL